MLVPLLVGIMPVVVAEVVVVDEVKIGIGILDVFLFLYLFFFSSILLFLLFQCCPVYNSSCLSHDFLFFRFFVTIDGGLGLNLL